MELTMNTIVVAVIVLFVVGVIVAIFSGMFKKDTGTIDKQICGLNDYDKDGIPNFQDNCPCDSNKEHQTVEECSRVCGEDEKLC